MALINRMGHRLHFSTINNNSFAVFFKIQMPSFSTTTTMLTTQMTVRDATTKRSNDLFLLGNPVAKNDGADKVCNGFWKRDGDKRIIDTPCIRIRSAGGPSNGKKSVCELTTFSFPMETVDHISSINKFQQILPSRLPPIGSPTPFQFPMLPDVVIDDPSRTHRPSVPISCPVTDNQTEIRASNRVKRQRKIHVRKKHKKQRIREFRFIITKRKNEREALSEAKWRKELSMSLKTSLEFDPDKYVRETIARAKWTPTADNTESMRKGVFWTEFMTVEQLFGVPDGDYIDKKHGFANEDDWEKILELREKYNKEYRRKKD